MAKTLEETQNKWKTRVSSSDESLISKTSPETKYPEAASMLSVSTN